MRAWRRYVRNAVRILGRRESVVALSITNEANFPISPNTSDGSYEGVRRGDRPGDDGGRPRAAQDRARRDIELGFSFAWRWIPDSDREFWEEIGELSTPRFRRALDYVGLQIYPGLVFPPAPRPGVSARRGGGRGADPAALAATCRRPESARRRPLGQRERLRDQRRTHRGRSQRESLGSTLREVHRFSGTLGISDFRYFNLRDNRTGGIGLLRRGRRPARRLQPEARVRHAQGGDRRLRRAPPLSGGDPTHQRALRGRKKARIERLPHPEQRCSGSTGVPQWRHGGFWATIDTTTRV